MERCVLCQRETEKIERHHLYPVKTRRKNEEFIMVCPQCGDTIHQQITNQELQKTYHTLESLREKLANYILWVSDKPVTQHFSVAKKKRKL